MLTLQKKISYEGDFKKAPVKDVNLEFNIPLYEYQEIKSGAGDAIIRRTIISNEIITVTKELKSTNYQLRLPEYFIVGKEDASIEMFKKYIRQSNKNLDDFSTRIDVQYFIDNKNKIGDQFLEAIYFIKKTTRAAKPDMMFLINKQSYLDLLKKLSSSSQDESYLLNVISLLVDINNDKYPVLSEETKNMDEMIMKMLSAQSLKKSADALKIIKKHFIDLFDFPLSIPEVKTIEVGGSFTVKTSDNSKIAKEDLLYYDLSVEYSISNPEKKNVPVAIHFDWNKSDKIQDNTVPFSFTDNNPIIQNGITGLVSVNVKGFDGSVLYAKEFKPEDPELGKIKIEVPQMIPIKLTPYDKTKSVDKNKKLRGQVIELSKKCPVKDLTVIVQAKKDGDKIWRIVGAATTDSAGNFSLPYPWGIFREAQAIVSLTPDDPAGIPIMAGKESNQTISDDFLYLLVKDIDCGQFTKEEECDCHNPKKSSRLPDHADMIGSDEYSQDLGGSCVNLSTPNRTLSEYNYQAVVRTSDPAVANYTLRKIETVSDVVDASLVALVAEALSALVDITNKIGRVKDNVGIVRTFGLLAPHVDSVNDALKHGLSGVSISVLVGALNHLNAVIALEKTYSIDMEPLGVLQRVGPLKSHLMKVIEAVGAATHYEYELVGGAVKQLRKPIDLNNPVAWQDATDDKKNLSLCQAVTIATGHILHYKSLFKADGYSLGDLLYSLALAPGQKKEIVVFDSSHTLQGAESQSISQGERLAAGIIDDREITNLLGGSMNESLRGGSSANTSGISAGIGVGAIVGPVGAVLGVSGGVSNSNSSASADSSRNVSQFFGEKLRQSIMQNAEGYRQLNASVVTTVQEGQRYTATTEVVANHNHCHALTMMYFEVLRHYAIYQELSSVEECVFVPLLLTNFTTENIYKWRDVLAQFLLPMPSETYLQPFSFMRGSGRQHPLLKAFDANERIKTNYANVDFPQGSYDDEQIRFIKGNMFLRVELERPQTPYDRIKSLPIRLKNTPTKEIDTEAMLNRALTSPNKVVNAVKNEVVNSVVGFFTGGLSMLVTGPPGQAVTEVVQTELGPQYKTVDHYTQVREAIFDAFMSLDATYENVPPAQCIRIKNFNPTTILGVSVSGLDFFHGNIIDKQLWTAYAHLLGYTDSSSKGPAVLQMLDAYFTNNLIAEWDDIFYNQMAPKIFDKIVSSINIPPIKIDFTSETKYKGGERLIRLNLNGTTSLKRNMLPLQLEMSSTSNAVLALHNLVTLNIENLNIFYSTSHYNGILFSGNVNDDLLDGTTLNIPENSEEKRNPKKEDRYLVYKLIEHLNSNLEHYNKVLWYNLDPDRRYMLLDGFNIQIFNDFGLPIDEPLPLRSLASVVKNELITVVGNSLVFPVAAGYKVSQSYITEKTEDDTEKVTLFDHYKPLTPIEPYRISVPTKGVFAEAVLGACNSCEKIETERLQDWNRFPNTDEPTTINPINPPTPTVTDWKAAFKDFTSPMINIQNAPAVPAPGAGLAGLSELLGKSGVFKDITGLDANQQNVLKTYLSNQENAKAFAEMAKEMVMQGHNSENSGKIMSSLNEAKKSGAISQDDYGKLVKEHLQQQIDGGESKKAELEKEKAVKPTLTDAAVKAAGQGKDVKAQKTDTEGNSESVDISTIHGSANGSALALLDSGAGSDTATDATVFEGITMIPGDKALLESKLITEPLFTDVEGFLVLLQLLPDENILDVVKKRFSNLDKTINPKTKFTELLNEFTANNAHLTNADRILFSLHFQKESILPDNSTLDQNQIKKVKELATDSMVARTFLIAKRVFNSSLAKDVMRQIFLLSNERQLYNINHVAYILATAYHESNMGKYMTERANGVSTNTVFTKDKYFFEAVPGVKKSYNGVNGNLLAGNQLKSNGDITDPADVVLWNGTAYPDAQTDMVKSSARACDFYRYIGRGLVQITGRDIYNKYSNQPEYGNEDFLANPDKVAELSVAARILVTGMMAGSFRSHKLSDYDTATGFAGVSARDIVNGDMARNGQHINDIAVEFKNALIINPKLDESVEYV